MTLTDVGTRYNGMELSPERVAAFFSITTATHQNTTSSPSPLPLPQREGSEQRVIPI